MDLTDKPSDLVTAEEDKRLAEIENTPVKGAKSPEDEPAPVIRKAGSSSAGVVVGRILLGLLIVGLAGVAGWFWWQNDQAQTAIRQKDAQLAAAASKTDAPAASTMPIENMTIKKQLKLSNGRTLDFAVTPATESVIFFEDTPAAGGVPELTFTTREVESWQGALPSDVRTQYKLNELCAGTYVASNIGFVAVPKEAKTGSPAPQFKHQYATCLEAAILANITGYDNAYAPDKLKALQLGAQDKITALVKTFQLH